MIFEHVEDGCTYKVYCCGGTVEFRCDLIDKPFKSFDALQDAVKAKKLALRKNFSNTTAFHVERWNKGIKKVTVTSLDGDKDAWVKQADGTRRKESRTSLYADEGKLRKVIALEANLKDRIEKEWEALQKWEPQLLPE